MSSSALTTVYESAGNKLLARWRAYCHSQALLHNKSRGHFKVINNALSITSMLLGSLSGMTVIGVASGSRSSLDNDSKQQDLYYSTVITSMGVAGVVASMLASVHKFLGVAELQREHDLYGDMFENLTNEIDMQIILEASMFQARMFVNTGEFLKYCKHRLDMLIDKAPPIPGAVLRRPAIDDEDIMTDSLTLTAYCMSSSHAQRNKPRPRRSISSPDVRATVRNDELVRASATLLH